MLKPECSQSSVIVYLVNLRVSEWLLLLCCVERLNSQIFVKLAKVTDSDTCRDSFIQHIQWTSHSRICKNLYTNNNNYRSERHTDLWHDCQLLSEHSLIKKNIHYQINLWSFIWQKSLNLRDMNSILCWVIKLMRK